MKKIDYVEQLKNYRPPLWTYILGWFANRREKKCREKTIRHIATIYFWVQWTDTKRQSSTWYICKENGLGQRFYEYGSDSSLLKKDAKSNSIYASLIVPWMYGKYSNEQLENYAKIQKRPEVHT